MTDKTTPHALIVDDDALLRMDAADILSDAGYRTWEANNADEALEILQAASSDIQLLFTDVHMPGKTDGFGLARECSSHWPHISILVASGLAQPGPDDMPGGAIFINKPFSVDIVRDRLREIVPDEEKPEQLR